MSIITIIVMCAFMLVVGKMLSGISLRKEAEKEKRYDKKNTISLRRKKGEEGEDTVETQLSLLDPSEYKVIHNGLFELKNGITVQIDHIVISRTGIFVIETKNYGNIVCQDAEDNWYQVWYNRKFDFYSPEKQNESHIKSLMYVLYTKNRSLFHSIIAFPNSVQLNVQSKTRAVKMEDLCVEIESEGLHVLTREEVNMYYNKLKARNIYNKKNLKKHRARVEQRYG